jgi:putative PIG3 family NAD(P)H quinone oxidoreductase
VVPAPGELLIRVTASGVNRADLSQIAGRYPSPPGEPAALGLEVAGIVDGTGARVCALLAGGGHAECVAAPEGQIFPCPANLELVRGAAIPEAYLTAFVNLVIEAGLEAGQTALVHAGASGVGLAAIQVAKDLGARVVATTRTLEKVAALEQAGADLALVVPSGDDFAGPVAARWGPGAVDVVLDPIGAASLAGDLAVLASGGRIICLATMSGAKAELDVSLLMKKRARIVGSTLRSRTRAEKALLVRRFAQEILPGFDAGRLRPVIDSVLPPERAAEAFQRMRENTNVGKILIAWS